MSAPVDPPTGEPGRASAGVLVVDDRPENLYALEAVIEPLGAVVTTARSGEEALRTLLHQDFALILLDVQMPGLDGFTTATMIKQHPRTASIPIIFLTAFDDHFDQALQGYTSGAVDYLVKPFDPWVLRSKVQVFLDLHRKTSLLEQQAAQLRAHVEQLRSSRAALADAQRIAQLGGWSLDVAADRVTGSEQLHRIFGWPLDDPLPPGATLFNQLRLSGHDARSLRAVADRLSVEGQVVRPDGEVRDVVVNVERPDDDDPARPHLVGTVQDVTERRAAQRALSEASRQLEQERELVRLLQEPMAPGALPAIGGLDVAACYRPAGSGLAGGDWYDVIPLPGDGARAGPAGGNEVLLVIGDVAGHGVPAASAMSQLRTALRAIALHRAAPAEVVADLQRYLSTSLPGAFATLLVVALDPVTGCCHVASAGHPPPLVLEGGRARVEWMPVGPPLGAGTNKPYEEVELELAPGATLVLYTDGLVERRGEPLDDGLARLAGFVEQPAADGWALVEQVSGSMCADGEPGDDVALLVVRRRTTDEALQLAYPAALDHLAPMRHGVRRWLAANGFSRAEQQDLVVAVGELVTNSCLHAYPALSPGGVRVRAELDGDVLRVEVADDGRWSTRTSVDGGRGLDLIERLGLGLTLHRGQAGTRAVVTAPGPRHRAGQPGGNPPGGPGRPCGPGGP